ncbi:MAG: ATP-binding region ATPase domain protein [Gemmatimonadetes bacterium]|nr:ATP-binding region ATPase domain protein [Gemmatimonadota bacterium]
MARSSLARISVVGFTVPLIAALLLMAGALIASDRALMRSAAAQLRIDAEQTRVAVEHALKDRAGTDLTRAELDSALRPLLLRAPAERSAAALVAGGDTILVTGRRAALRHDPHYAVAVAGPSGAVWLLTVAHGRGVAALRTAMWVLSLITVAILGVGVIRERRQAMRVSERSAELERLYSEVARANTAKSEFLANISHELRTPLNAIVGFVELLKDGVYGDLSPRQVPPVDRIAASATHLRHLVDQVLDIAKIAAGRLEVHPETLVLRPFVLNVASELESLVNERGLSFSIAVGASLPRVRTDPAHLRQILVNLIGNAVKYTPAGSVGVRARMVGASTPAGSGPRRDTPDDPFLASRSPDVRRAWIALQVVDTGVGIAPADQARIFQEFEQVNAGPRGDSMQRGTGLGLAISRRLAQLLGGDIGLESQVGKGSTFTLWLPVHPTDLEPLLAAAARPGAPVA